MITKVCLLSALVAAVCAFSQIPFLKKCPTFQPMSNFDMDRYWGGWYELERYPMVFEYYTSCVWTNYSQIYKNSKGEYLNIDMTFVRNGEKDEGALPAWKPNNGEGSFIIMPAENTEPNSFVLKTDYDTYSLNYDCVETLWGTNDFAWIYSRTKTLPQETIDELKAILTDMGSDISKFHVQDQLVCDN